MDGDKMTNHYMAKVCVLGESSVGKSSIAVRFVENKFEISMASTIGAAYLSRYVYTPKGTLYKLHIWDTAGQERYKTLTPLYYRDSAVVIITYDITQRDTFVKGAKGWFDELRRNGQENALLVVIGNKLDLAGNRREVKREDGAAFAAEIGATFHETSALTGENVGDVFMDICTTLEKSENKNLKYYSPDNPTCRTVIKMSPTHNCRASKTCCTG